MITISQGLFAGCAVAYSTERNHKKPTWAITALQANQLFLLIGATFAQAGIASAAFRLLARVTFFVTPLVMFGHILRPTPSDSEKKWIQRLNYGYVITAAVTSIALTALGGTALGMGVLTVLAVKAVFHFQKDKLPARVRDGFTFATKIGAGIAALGYGHLTLQKDVTYPFAFLASALFFGMAEYIHRPRGGEPGADAEGGEQPGAHRRVGEAHHAGEGASATAALPQYQSLDAERSRPSVVVARQRASQPQPPIVVMAEPSPPQVVVMPAPQPAAPPAVAFLASPSPVVYPAVPAYAPSAATAYVPYAVPATAPFAGHSRPAPQRPSHPAASVASSSSFLSPALPFSAPPRGLTPSAPAAPRAPASAPKGNVASAALPF